MKSYHCAIRVRPHTILVFNTGEWTNYLRWRTNKQTPQKFNWHYDYHTENLEWRWKTWEQKKWITVEIFNFNLKIFSAISVSLDNKARYFRVIILDYHCGFLCKYFSVWFPRLFSEQNISKIFSVIFGVINSKCDMTELCATWGAMGRTLIIWLCKGCTKKVWCKWFGYQLLSNSRSGWV